MQDNLTLTTASQVQRKVNQTVADLAAWSIQCAMEGVGPARGFAGEALTGYREGLIGKPLCNGWRNLDSFEALSSFEFFGAQNAFLVSSAGFLKKIVIVLMATPKHDSHFWNPFGVK